jgi:hypothetical protein
MGSVRIAPEMLFLIVASITGLILTFLITPLAGGNEVLNFQRAAMIANGKIAIEPTAMPGGIAELIRSARRQFPEGSRPPYAYPRAEMERLKALPLDAHRPAVIEPNPIAVLHPVAYLPQVPAIAAGQWLGARPLTIFYAGRLAGLFANILLVFFAIRICPVRKAGLAALALLPPMLFARATLDADQFNVGLAFLFTAMVAKAASGEGRLRAGPAFAMAVTAFALAQAKSAYLLLPLMVLAIPRERFASATARAWTCVAIVVPGLLASVGWMLFLKDGAFASLRYRTWSGIVEPDRQIALVLSDPIGFVATIARTLTATPLIPRSIVDFFGTFGPPVTLPLAPIVAVALLFTLVVLTEAESDIGPAALRRWRLLAAGVSIATVVIILTLHYAQWTRFGAPVVDGFNARYLYPLAPLLVFALRTGGGPAFGLGARSWLVVLSIAGAAATIWIATATYVA